jgi:alkylation response protein AidB-like acyl-CoA dehydrogenase
VQRTIMESEHELFRSSVRTFLEREVVPYHRDWERQGVVPRELWLKAGAAGLLGLGVPEQYGGVEVDFRFNAVLDEELMRVQATGPGFPVHIDIVAPYLLRLASDAQKKRWLPGFCSGEIITAIAMTEPAAGSDLRAIQTVAKRCNGGWRVSGQKTFITNAINADLVIVVTRTDLAAGHKGFSLLVVERGMPGFERGRNLDKLGQHAQDTGELFFDDVFVPEENLLGEENRGFYYLMENLAQERLGIAVLAVAVCETALAITLAYCAERMIFGKPISSFQSNRFRLAELATKNEIARVFIDRCIEEHIQGRLTAEDAAMAKWWTTELQKTVVDECVQLHGGYGYMSELQIARMYADTRPATIYGGSTETMKEIIARSMGLSD